MFVYILWHICIYRFSGYTSSPHVTEWAEIRYFKVRVLSTHVLEAKKGSRLDPSKPRLKPYLRGLGFGVCG